MYLIIPLFVFSKYIEYFENTDIHPVAALSGQRRDSANLLKAILKGEYAYEQVIKMADDLLTQLDVVYQQSTLPQNPDLNQINDLCIELVEMQGW